MARNTYQSALKKLDIEQEHLAREGTKSAYQHAEPDDFLETSPDRHGQYPMDVVHIDHTLLDIQVLSGQTEEILVDRPTITLAIDAYSRAIVGMHITLAKPSKDHVLCCLSDIVRRRKRLPTTIVVDGGSEFYSSDVERNCAFYGCCIRSREGKPQSGNVIERAFGIQNDQVLHETYGTTKLARNVRVLTQAVDPRNLACVPLADLMEGLDEYWFEVFNKRWKKLAHFMTPDAKFRKGQRDLGLRKHVRLHFDKDFKIRMLPTIQGTTWRAVDGLQGFVCNYDIYYHPLFYQTRGRSKVENIKINPWDPSSVFAWYEDQWIECICRQRREQAGDSFFERRAFFEERPHLIADVMAAQDKAADGISEVVDRFNAHRDRPQAPSANEFPRLAFDSAKVVATHQNDHLSDPLPVAPPELRPSRTTMLPSLDGAWREGYQ